jgi:hypothetical protein
MIAVKEKAGQFAEALSPRESESPKQVGDSGRRNIHYGDRVFHLLKP